MLLFTNNLLAASVAVAAFKKNCTCKNVIWSCAPHSVTTPYSAHSLLHSHCISGKIFYNNQAYFGNFKQTKRTSHCL